MTDFQDIFDGTVTLTEAEKAGAARSWLKKEYNIEVKDNQVLAALLAVHTHNSETPQHFGHPLITSSFGRSIVQIVFTTGNWHLSFRKEPRAEFTLVHPKSEGGSWANVQNRSAAMEIGLLLKKGELNDEAAVEVREVPKTPSAYISGSNVQLHIPENVTDESDLGSRSVDILSGLDSTKYGSVTIDLSAFGAPEEKK